MKYSRKIGLAGLILVAAAFHGAESSAADRDNEMPPGMSRYYFGLIRKGPAWTADVNESTQAMQKAHLANISRLVEEGVLSVAGPFEGGDDLRGIFIFNVQTLDEAEALVATDPAVRSQHLVVDLVPWWGPSALATLLSNASGTSAQH